MKRMVAVLALVGHALSSCAGGPPTDDSKISFSISAYGADLATVPAYVTFDQGFFADEDLEVEVISFKSGPDALAAVQSGDLDVASNSGMNQMLINSGTTSSETQQLVQIYSQQPQATWTLMVSDAVRVSGDLATDLKSLKGETVGVPAIGSEGQMIVEFLLADAGLDPATDITVLGVDLGPEAVSALKVGQIDAIVALSPVTSLIEGAGGQVIFDMADTDISFLSNWDFAAYMTTRRHAADRSEAMVSFQRAMDKAIEFVQNQDNAAVVAQIWAEQNTSLPKNCCCQSSSARVTFTGVIDCAGIKNQAEFAVAAGLLEASATATCEDLACPALPTIWKSDDCDHYIDSPNLTRIQHRETDGFRTMTELTGNNHVVAQTRPSLLRICVTVNRRVAAEDFPGPLPAIGTLAIGDIEIER